MEFDCKIIKCLLVSFNRNIQIFSLVFITTLTGVIFRENITTELLPPVQALSLVEPARNDGKTPAKFGVGDSDEVKRERFGGNVGTSFVIISKNNSGTSDAFYKILLNYQEEVARISQAPGSQSKVFQVQSGENIYTIVDEKNQIIDEFILRGIENNK